jgi:hypothetical protein
MNQEDKQVTVRTAVEQAWRDRVKFQGQPTKGKNYLKAEVEFLALLNGTSPA